MVRRVVISHFFNEAYLLPWWLKHHREIFDHGVLIDTVETATTWENVGVLHSCLGECIRDSIRQSGAQSLVTTHLSHVYRDGASLYVTFLAKSQPQQALDQWQQIKDAATACIMANGGALSHHHGVGHEHARWLAQEDGVTGMHALAAVKRTLDPQAIMNPAKLFPETML